jgi:hypothetical protein
LIAILNYRVKIKKEAIQLQRQQDVAMNNGGPIAPPQPPMPLPSSNSIIEVEPDDEEAPIMANAVIMPLAEVVQDRTLEADAFLDPTATSATQTPPAAAAAHQKQIPRNENPVRFVEPPGPGPSTSILSSTEQQQQREDADEKDEIEEHNDENEEDEEQEVQLEQSEQSLQD